MRRSLLLAWFLLVAGGVSACDDGIVIGDPADDVNGSGTIVTEARDVTGFDRIRLAGEGTVLVTEGGDASLTVETDDNLLSYIETFVEDGVLEIATQSGIDIEPSDSVVYRVAAPAVNGVELTGAGSFRLPECETDAFSIVLAGAGDVHVDSLVANDLEVTITGVGSVKVAGEVASQVVTLPGAGDYQGRELESTRATVTTSGVGSATVWVTEELTATVSGVGSIDYFGSPRVTESVSGIGTVTHRG